MSHAPPASPVRVVLGPADLNEGESRPYEAGQRYILVTRWEGSLFAIDDQCNHAGCLLSGGWREERAIVCPCHEHMFDVVTGRNVTMPRLYEDQPVFPLIVENGQIVVELTGTS